MHAEAEVRRMAIDICFRQEQIHAARNRGMTEFDSEKLLVKRIKK